MCPLQRSTRHSSTRFHTAPFAPTPWSNTSVAGSRPERISQKSRTLAVDEPRPALLTKSGHAFPVVGGADEHRLSEPLENAAGFGVDALARVDDVLRHAHRQRRALEQNLTKGDDAVHERLV